MMSQTKEVRNPGPFRVSPMMKTLFLLFAVVGIATFVAGLSMAPGRAWPAYLVNFFFFTTLGLSGAFYIAVQHITNAYWSVTVRRLAELITGFLPVALVLSIPLIIARHQLFEWANHETVAHDAVLMSKGSYLNSTFFAIRLIGAGLIWVWFAHMFRGNSLKQDKSGDEKLTLSNVKLATVFLPVFAITYTLVAFDLLMSLEPHWFSTIFGVYCFAGLHYSGLALLALLAINGRKQGLFSDEIVNDNHIHDIGKLMFAFTVFWGYIMFSQLMLQWYANLPEETPYFIKRFHGGWWTYSCTLFVVKFCIPFFGLLPRGAKRCGSYLSKMAILMICAEWMDVYFMAMPPFFPDGPVFGWVEAGTFLGFLGIFGMTVTRALESAPAIALKDPRMAQCLAHNQ